MRGRSAEGLFFARRKTVRAIMRSGPTHRCEWCAAL